MTELALGDCSIVVPAEREIYNDLRLKYQSLAEKAQKDFSDRFLEHFPVLNPT